MNTTQILVTAYISAIQVEIAITFEDGKWTAKIDKVIDNDGNNEWDANEFNNLVLSHFVYHKHNLSAEELRLQLNTTVKNIEPTLPFETCL